MKLGQIKEKKELVATAMIAIAAISAVLIVVKVTGFFVTTANAGNTVEEAISHGKPDDKNVAAQLDKLKEEADVLKKKNLFSPPPPKRHPVKAVLGILGDEALINGRWYKAGDKIADARIVAVAPTAVTVEWDCTTKVFNPIDGGTPSGPSGPSISRQAATASSRPGLVVTGSAAGARPSKVDRSVKDTSMETYNNMSKTKKDMFKKVMAKNKEQYKQMAPDERARFKAKIIERIGRSREIRGSQPVKLTGK